MFARTERLLLRPGWIEDAPALAHAADAESARYILGNGLESIDGTQAARLLAAARDSRLPDLLILAPARGSQFVGGIGLVRTPHAEVELRCWIARDERHRGYAAEAARAIIAMARHSLGLPCICAVALTEEGSDRRLLARLGFVPAERIARADARRAVLLPASLHRLDLGQAETCKPLAA